MPSEIFGESKYFGSGQKRTVVPVCFFGTVPITSSRVVSVAVLERHAWIWPSRRIVTSTRVDRALTTETPTPCRPPENW